jgi:hypothetical protein
LGSLLEYVNSRFRCFQDDKDADISTGLAKLRSSHKQFGRAVGVSCAGFNCEGEAQYWMQIWIKGSVWRLTESGFESGFKQIKSSMGFPSIELFGENQAIAAIWIGICKFSE